MLVQDWMAKPAITIDADETLQTAVDLMTDNGIGILPVMKNRDLVGIVTDRDIKQAQPSSVVVIEMKHIIYHMGRVKMASIMTRDVITVWPDYTVEEAAQTLLQNSISGCPVLDYHGQIVGIITRNDLFRAMVAVSGVPNKGLQVGFLIEDRPGSIKELTDKLRRRGARIMSIVSTYEKAPKGHRYTYLRIFDLSRDELPGIRSEVGASAEMLYMIDLENGVRETYTSNRSAAA